MVGVPGKSHTSYRKQCLRVYFVFQTHKDTPIGRKMFPGTSGRRIQDVPRRPTTVTGPSTVWLDPTTFKGRVPPIPTSIGVGDLLTIVDLFSEFKDGFIDEVENWV